MTSSTIATWAEPVRWTADDLLRLSDAGFRFELVQGEVDRALDGGEVVPRFSYPVAALVRSGGIAGGR